MATNQQRQEQPKWTSARVARLKEQQTQPSSSSAPSLAAINAQRSSATSRWTIPNPTISLAPSTRRTCNMGSLSSNSGLISRDALKQLGGKVDRMALLASPSRGQDSADLVVQGSTDLTNHATQQEFRAYISEQIEKRFAGTKRVELSVLQSSSYIGGAKYKDKESDTKRDFIEQVVLLVRKLREGCVASGRVDAFTLDVYELSVYLTLLCLNIPQLSSSLPRLVLDLYPLLPTTSSSGTALKDMENILPLSPADRSTPQAHMSTLLLLRTLCLASHASRLGQYASSNQPLTSRLGEFPALRSSIPSDHDVSLADKAYRAVKDANVFALNELLIDTKLSVWQRILLLQLVQPLRDVAWKTVRKAYMRVPVPLYLRDPAAKDDAEGLWIEKLLLLGTDCLPKPPSSLGIATVTPDDWDADTLASQLSRVTLSSSDPSRLPNFLASVGFSDDDVKQRIVEIRGGSGIGLKVR